MIKVLPVKVAPKVAIAILIKKEVHFFQNSQNVIQYLGLFYKKNCHLCQK